MLILTTNLTIAFSWSRDLVARRMLRIARHNLAWFSGTDWHQEDSWTARVTYWLATGKFFDDGVLGYLRDLGFCD